MKLGGKPQSADNVKKVAEPSRNVTKHVTVIAVGGALNTLYLQSRNVTHDVDIFGTNSPMQPGFSLMRRCKTLSDTTAISKPTGSNTETQMWMPEPLHSRLTQAAERQNVRIFDMPGLTIYVAPWAYAFSAKVNRLLTGGGQSRSYDLNDAITYIHEYIASHGNKRILMTTALH
ncbi:hypothetical protein E4U53_001672 [Claviceps sorghi]|nr:hypothetical protein E4U53_001672 [Claviceps sorghi]